MKKEKMTEFVKKIMAIIKKSAKKFWLAIDGFWRVKAFWIVVSTLVVLVCFFGAMGLGVYRLAWDNPVSNFMIKYFPYPAAIVGGDVVKLYDWRVETEAVQFLKVKQLGSADINETGKEVMEKLVYDEILSEMADDYDVKVTNDDLQKSWTELTEQVGSEETLIQNIKDYFNWDEETFKARVVYSDTLRLKLDEKISESEKNQAEALKRAEKVLVEVNKNETDFAVLAEQYSEDQGSASAGGALGWFPRGVMVKEFEDAVFALQSGEVSGLVKTQFGYHIIKLLDRKTEKVDNVDTEQVQASHILLSFKNFSSVLEEYKAKIKVTKFVTE